MAYRLRNAPLPLLSKLFGADPKAAHEPEGEYADMVRAACAKAGEVGIDAAPVLDMMRKGGERADSPDGHVKIRLGPDRDGRLAMVDEMLGTLRIRYWTGKGAPDIELGFNSFRGELTYAKADGERIA